MKKLISHFKSVVDKNPTVTTIEEFLNQIESGEEKDLVLKVRRVKKEGNPNKLRDVKKQLPTVTISGNFPEGLTGACNYSGFVVLDIDNIQDNLNETKKVISECEYTYCVFVSPSGVGLKVLIKVSSFLEHHKTAFNQLKGFFENLTGVEVDEKGSNHNRHCYISYDEDLYRNEDSKIFEVDTTQPESKTVISSSVNRSSEGPDTDLIEKIVLWSEETMICITDTYATWYKIALSIITCVADREMARELFLRVCRVGSNHDEKESIKKFEYCCEVNKGDLKIGTILHYARKKGFSIDTKDLIPESGVFWQTGDGKVFVKSVPFYRFLDTMGIKMYVTGSDVKYVRNEGGIVKPIQVHVVKQEVQEYIESLPGYLDDGVTSDDLLEAFINKSNTLLGKSNMEFIKPFNQKLHKDSEDKCYFYFRNGAVEITSSEIRTVPFDSLDGLVWEKDLLKFDIEVDVKPKHSDFSEFVKLISNEKEDRILCIESTMGYLLHRYKNPSLSKAVVFMDEVIAEDHKAEGGKGKSIVSTAIGKMRTVDVKDGKNYRFDNFAFQGFTKETDVVVYDDVEERFDFEKLFSAITGDINVRDLYKSVFTIPYADSPKFCISTNFVVNARGGNSEDRRKHEVEFSDYFGAERTPVDEFGKRFFEDWNKEEWNSFYNYMFRCVQLFLSKGLMEYEQINIDRRKLIATTNNAFIDFIEDFDLQLEKTYDIKEIRECFVEDNPSHRITTARTFNRWMKNFIDYKGWTTPEWERTKNQREGKQWLAKRVGKQVFELKEREC